jgi:hypothetical protein
VRLKNQLNQKGKHGRMYSNVHCRLFVSSSVGTKKDHKYHVVASQSSEVFIPDIDNMRDRNYLKETCPFHSARDLEPLQPDTEAQN